MPSPMRRALCAASVNWGTAGTYALASTTSSRKRVEVTTLWRRRFPIHGTVRAAVFVEVHRAKTAILVGAQPLLPARVGGFQRIQMRDRVGPVRGIQEENARLAVVMRLLDDLIEELNGRELFYACRS